MAISTKSRENHMQNLIGLLQIKAEIGAKNVEVPPTLKRLIAEKKLQLSEEDTKKVYNALKDII